MNFRLANTRDINKIAKIHHECSVKQAGGFMHNLGIMFLNSYYSVLISEENSLILVAEDERGFIAGFHSGSICPIEHKQALKRNWYKFLVPIFIKLITNPLLLNEILIRRKSLFSGSIKYKFSSDEGPRAEYWAWSPTYSGENKSILLREKWCQILNVLGYDNYYLEVDSNNKLVFNYYKLQSAVIVSKIMLNDGRERYILKLKTINNLL